ncbi:MAG: hypothetical protein K6B46_05090 [Opitutales bacterium]|nr:hypothetical protein [Opitutales bacterium]
MNLRKVLDYSLVEAHLKKLWRHLREQENTGPVLDIVLLEGARYFYEHLMASGDLGHDCRMIAVHSYSGTQSTGTVKGLALDDDLSAYRTINVFDDLCDTGLTLEETKKFLKSKTAAGTALNFYTLFNKAESNRFELSFPALEIPPFFVVGCGLDYNGRYRELDGVFELLLSEK